MPSSEQPDVAALVQRFIALMNRKTAGKSTMYMHESGLTFPQIIVLWALAESDETISGLAAKLRMSMGATSQLVDKLVDAQMVEREEDANDRRVRIVKLRAPGRKYLEQLGQIRRREIDEALRSVPSDAKARFARGLTEVVRALERDAAKEDSAPGED
jgi:DNA-binding MarR family transcriptional regulator